MSNIEIRTIYKPDGIYLKTTGSQRREKGSYNQENLPNIYDISSTVNNPVYRKFEDIPEPGKSLQSVRPDVAAEFMCLDSELAYYKQHGEAYLKPKDIRYGTTEYAWFKCSKCQYIWKAYIHNRTRREIIKDDNNNIIEYVNTRINCPLCSNNQNESIYEEYLHQLLQPELTKRGFTLEKHVFLSRFDNSYVAGMIDQEYQMRQLMNFDFYIPQIRTFIDYNGSIHGQDNYKKRDNEKKTWAYNHGFNLIAISCGEIDKSDSVKIEKSSHYIKYKIHRERKYSPANNSTGIVKKTRDEIAWAAEQILKEIGSTCRPIYYNRINNKYQVDSSINNYYKNQVVNKPIIFDKATGKFKLRNDIK